MGWSKIRTFEAYSPIVQYQSEVITASHFFCCCECGKWLRHLTSITDYKQHFGAHMFDQRLESVESDALTPGRAIFVLVQWIIRERLPFSKIESPMIKS
jgi:hypothetical protein